MTNKAGIEAKMDQLVKLNSDLSIMSLDKMKVDMNTDIEEANDIAQELESSLGSHNESSKLIKKDIKSMTHSLTKVREELLKCEDTSGTDEQLYTRLKTVRDHQESLAQYEAGISSIEQKIKTMQEEFGSGDVKSLMKEFGTLEKKFEGVSTQAAKLTGMIQSILEKHYVDKVKELTKFNNTFKDKITWCLPEPSSDKYSIECKLESLADLEATVENMRPVLEELDICGKVIIKIVDADKQKEIESTMQILSQQIDVIEGETKKIKVVLESSINMWRKYELSSENLSSWLKEREDRVRQATGTQVNMDTVEQEMGSLLTLQAELTGQATEIQALVELSQEITSVCPESRVDQQVKNISARYATVTKSLAKHMDKLEKMLKNKDIQGDSIKEFKAWLDNSRKQLKEFENPSILNFESKANDFKLIMADKENGSVLLEKAIETGEDMFAQVAPNDREKMRAEIRALRDSWENHIDYMNTINKSIEALLVKKSSFEESFSQLQMWIQCMSSKVQASVLLSANIVDKKATLQEFKQIQLDISSHEGIFNGLKEKISTMGDSAISAKFDSTMTTYKELSQKNQKNVDVATEYVSDHEKMDELVEKTRDMTNYLNIELSVLADTPFDSEDAGKRIQSVDDLLAKKVEGDKMISSCQTTLAKVLAHTSPEGCLVLSSDLQQVTMAWKQFIQSSEDFKKQQQKINKGLGEFRGDMEVIVNWIREMGGRVKDQPMRSNVEAKENHLKSLQTLQTTIEAKGKEIDEVAMKAGKVQGDSELSSQVSRMLHKYEILKKNIKEVIQKYDSFVKEHQNFNEQYVAFIEWIEAVIDDLGQFSEIVGDLKILQERRNNIEELEEMRASESIKYDTIVELGEKLYSHTSIDGKDLIRQQLKELRSKWETLMEEIQQNSNKIDLCLQQFSDFTNSQEQLTKWLKDIEKHMQQHTELKPSLQEKKAQLQNHKIVHQEVTSHNSLVETVCTKAQELVDQTHDKSLNVYIESIRALFKNIGLKSKDLMDKLATCVEDHTKYQALASTFSDFTTNQCDLLSQCADVSGEKTDLERKKQILVDLRNNKEEGAFKLAELEEMCSKVSRSTSRRGCDKLRQEIAEVRESWSTHLALIEDVEINIEKGIAQWETFNDDISSHHEWFKLFEGIFRNQQLQDTAKEKGSKLQDYRAKREDIIGHEKTIDDFVNNSHNLLHNSGVERLKPVITQISNRYQLLHVLSKEVVSKWQGIVEDHEAYCVRQNEMETWLDNINEAVERASRESDIEKKMETLQTVSSEQDPGPLKIANFSASGERLFPDTSSQGRELLRGEIRQVRERWEAVMRRMGELQKRQDAQLQHWTSYQDSLGQLTSWLEGMEAAGQQEQVNWLSVQETRSRLLKYKTTLQDIISHKRFIEAVNEKGAAVIHSSPLAPAEEIQQTIENMNERYEALGEMMRKTVTNMEEAIDCIQQYQDLQKSHQDWQKQMWDRLSVYTDYTGSKHALDSRLEKIGEMQKQVADGERVLESIRKHISGMDEDKIPSKIKDAMERDLSNIK
jgi:nesprin-1